MSRCQLERNNPDIVVLNSVDSEVAEVAKYFFRDHICDEVSYA